MIMKISPILTATMIVLLTSGFAEASHEPGGWQPGMCVGPLTLGCEHYQTHEWCTIYTYILDTCIEVRPEAENTGILP